MNKIYKVCKSVDNVLEYDIQDIDDTNVYYFNNYKEFVLESALDKFHKEDKVVYSLDKNKAIKIFKNGIRYKNKGE